jgi:hypothetical protein
VVCGLHISAEVATIDLNRPAFPADVHTLLLGRHRFAQFVAQDETGLVLRCGYGMPPKEKEWADKARQFLKAELKRRSVSYKELAERFRMHRLGGDGVRDREQTLPGVVRGDVLPGYSGCFGDEGGEVVGFVKGRELILGPPMSPSRILDDDSAPDLSFTVKVRRVSKLLNSP